VSRWSTALGKGSQLGATFYVDQAVAPWLDNLVDPLPVIAPDLATLVISGLVVVFSTDALFALPELTFRWKDPTLREDFPTVVQMQHPSAPRGMDIEVRLEGQSLLARGLRALLRGSSVRAEASLSPPGVVRLRREIGTAPGVNVASDSVTFPFPAEALSWVSLSAEVTDQAPTSVDVAVQHSIGASGLRSVVGRLLVLRSHNLTTLRVIRSP
jgi:hypothetical protein